MTRWNSRFVAIQNAVTKNLGSDHCRTRWEQLTKIFKPLADISSNWTPDKLSQFILVKTIIFFTRRDLCPLMPIQILFTTQFIYLTCTLLNIAWMLIPISLNITFLCHFEIWERNPPILIELSPRRSQFCHLQQFLDVTLVNGKEFLYIEVWKDAWV